MKDRKIRILHLIESDGVYGAEKVVLHLCQETLRDTDFEPLVGCIVGDTGRLSALAQASRFKQVPAIDLRLDKRRMLSDLPRLYRTIASLRPQVVHAHGYKASLLAGLLRPFIGAAVLPTCHLRFTGETSSLTTRLLMRAEVRYYRWLPYVVAVSSPIRDFILASGVPPQRVVVIPNGVELSDDGTFQAETRARVRADLDIASDTFVILNVARLTEQKAQRDILLACRRLLDAGHDCTALIVGEGELRSTLQESILAMGLGQRVRLLGFRSDIPALMAAADLFVLPSLDEGMPMSLLEAMAARLPIVATPVGAIPDVIEHQKDGLLVPVGHPDTLADAIDRCLTDVGLRKRLADAAHAKLVSHYSSRAMFRRYRELYRALAGNDTSGCS
jgi:glycosyltransferase involved in cell wall biosynthesis